MDFEHVMRALRSGWWLVAAGLLLGGLTALALTLLATPLYTAQAQLFVSTTNTGTTSEVFQGSQFSQERVTSYAQLLEGEELAARVVERLRLDRSANQVAAQIEAAVVPETVLLNVSVVDPDPERAQRIANALGIEFPLMVAALEAPQNGGGSPVKVTVTETPQVPDEPSFPQPERNVALGLISGLILGSVATVLRSRLDRSIKDPKEIPDLVGVPLVGTVLRDETIASKHTIDPRNPSRTAEDYRQLRTSLQFLNVDKPPKVIMVSSAMPSEGKTTVVLNLALALSEAGRRVTVVEADLRRPRFTRYLGLVGGVGLTNVLAGSADVADVVQTFGEATISVIPAGPMPPNPSQLLASASMVSLVEDLRGKNDYVLVDAPPLLPVADATGLAVMMDGVILSVRYGSTRRDQLQQAVAMLERVGATPLGAILNIVPSRARITTAYGYRYDYGETS